MGNNYLVASDLQIPFEAEKALEFCKYIKRHFKVANDHCLCVGDEIDGYFGSVFGKSPDMKHSALTELDTMREKLRKWYHAFPEMKLATSNHGMRWVKKAMEAEIPSQLLRRYEEILQAPEGWKWKDQWFFNDKHPFRMIHGMGYSGANGAKNAALDANISTVIGHLHSFAGVQYFKMMDGKRIWAANSGCLIDVESLAFHYGKYNRYQPTLGAMVILNNGSTPCFIPYE